MTRGEAIVAIMVAIIVAAVLEGNSSCLPGHEAAISAARWPHSSSPASRRMGGWTSNKGDRLAYMVQHWFALRDPSEAANWWVRKAGAEHYGEHLLPLRAWVAEMVEARTRPPSDEWDS
jgi:hypothetical protein